MKKAIYILGDIHGEFYNLKYYIDTYSISDCIIIQVGDFGVGFETEKKDKASLNILNKFFKKRDIIMYVIRGNHDNPKYFDGKYKYSNLILLKDYSVLDIQGIKFLFVGGAISIDRKSRVKGINYWIEEKFVLDEQKLLSISGIEVAVTHNSPSFAFPFGLGNLAITSAEKDPHLLTELQTERLDITKMHDILRVNNKIKKWYYGHFHYSKTEEYDGTAFNCLDIDEFKELIL